MPVFHRPRTVIVSDDGGSPLAAIAAVVVLAVVISAASAILVDIVTALAIITAATVLGSAAILAVVLRRNGLGVVPRGRAVRQARAPELPARPQRQAIGQPVQRVPVIRGEVISRQD